MHDRIDWQYLFTETRARVYLLWAVLATVGFIATHYYQRQHINGAWFLIELIGLGYMYRVMPLRVKQMRNIFLAWFVPLLIGLAFSVAIFYVQSSSVGYMIAHLGAYWLIVMAIGYLLNGLVDRPSGWYWFAAVLNLLMGILCYTVDAFTAGQYLIAAIVSAWSMLNLWLFRSEA